MSKRDKIIVATVPTLIVLSIALAVAAVIMAALYVQERTQPRVVVIEQQSPVVSLGAAQYDFSGDRAIKIEDDESLNALEAKLVEKAERSMKHDSCRSAAYIVKVMNSEKTQALLGYGCDGPTAPMHVVLRDGEWDFISPTNKFDQFNIPVCDYANENQLSSDVAPVCHYVEGDRAVYVAR